MCWETKTILKPIKHKAQKDIQAKKVLRICHNGDLSSPFFDMMTWVPETQYTISEGLNLINAFPKNVFSRAWHINDGFHCYSMNNKVGLSKIGSIVVKKGSNYVTSMFNDFSDLKVFEVIIPQGSTCLTLTIEYRFKAIGLWYFLDIIDNRCGSGILFNGQQMALLIKFGRLGKIK